MDHPKETENSFFFYTLDRRASSAREMDPH